MKIDKNEFCIIQYTRMKKNECDVFYELNK